MVFFSDNASEKLLKLADSGQGDAPMSRAGFFGYLWQQAKSQVVDALETKWDNAKAPFEGPRHFLRPPGAVTNDNLFMALCTKCDACTAACPHEAISVHYGAGYPYDGTPVLANLSQSPCLLCEDLPCIQSCPTTALQPLESIAQVKIGIAKINNTVCVAYQGKSCTTCVDVCPLPDVAIALVEGLPMVYDACTGCGICQYHCPTDETTGEKSIQVYAI